MATGRPKRHKIGPVAGVAKCQFLHACTGSAPAVVLPYVNCVEIIVGTQIDEQAASIDQIQRREVVSGIG
ncbi:MAG TPA: hypothetical protein EYN26_04085 [Chromatiales bacterium]|nr:hypothetical protein [Chromatiales bacterium]